MRGSAQRWFLLACGHASTVRTCIVGVGRYLGLETVSPSPVSSQQWTVKLLLVLPSILGVTVARGICVFTRWTTAERQSPCNTGPCRPRFSNMHSGSGWVVCLVWLQVSNGVDTMLLQCDPSRPGHDAQTVTRRTSLRIRSQLAPDRCIPWLFWSEPARAKRSTAGAFSSAFLARRGRDP